MRCRAVSVLLLAGVVFSAAAKADERLSNLLDQGKQAFQAGKFDEAERYGRMALSLAERAGDEVQRAEALGELGRALIAKGRYEEARSVCVESLGILRSSESRRYLPVVLNHLGLLSMKQGDYAQAEVYFKEGLRAIKGTDPHNAYAAYLHFNLGTLYDVRHETGKAEKAFRSSIEVIEKELGPDRSELAPALGSLGALYSARKKWKEATALFERALHLIENFPGTSQLGAAGVLDAVAFMHYARGEFAAAEDSFRQAYEIRLRIFGPEHVAVAGTELNIGATLTALNRNDEAEKMLVDALRIYEKAVGADSAEAATALEKLARLFDQSNRKSEAKDLAARAENIRFDLAHTVRANQLR